LVLKLAIYTERKNNDKLSGLSFYFWEENSLVIDFMGKSGENKGKFKEKVGKNREKSPI